MRSPLIKTLSCLILFALLLIPGSHSTKAGSSQLPVDIVFTLDLSASTNGLIDDVRDRIWDLHNHINSMRPTPELRIGVVGFARPSFGFYNQLVKVICPLTTDMDYLSDELYKLRPNIEKGDQYVGAAIRASVELMNWSGAPNAIRQMYLAGNGNVGTGTFDFREANEMAAQKGITINTLYCYSSLRSRDIAGWQEIAEATGGELFDVKVHKIVPHAPTVYNRERLIQLSKELSSTYIYYGTNGFNRYKMMVNNDKNTLQSGQSTFEAMLFNKISDRYQNKQQDWDLVDCIKSRKCDLKKVEAQFLSDSLRKRNPEQLFNHIESIKEKRVRVINQLRIFLPYERQTILNRTLIYDKKQTEMIIENVVLSTINDKLKEKGITVPM